MARQGRGVPAVPLILIGVAPWPALSWRLALLGSHQPDRLQAILAEALLRQR